MAAGGCGGLPDWWLRKTFTISRSNSSQSLSSSSSLSASAFAWARALRAVAARLTLRRTCFLAALITPAISYRSTHTHARAHTQDQLLRKLEPGHVFGCKVFCIQWQCTPAVVDVLVRGNVAAVFRSRELYHHRSWCSGKYRPCAALVLAFSAQLGRGCVAMKNQNLRHAKST
jgi:hypothetical protein